MKKKTFPRRLLTEDMRRLLEKKEFIDVGTCESSGKPNVAPKFLIKAEDNHIYLADYVFGRTFVNLKKNSNVSLSTINLDTLTGLQMNGIAKIMVNGPEFKRLIKEMQSRQVKFSASRLIEGLRKERRYRDFEVTLPEQVCIFKVRINEVAEIGKTGKVKRKK
ncbi:MAG: pyridoxamine 5'-phosphate oxidase family protein [Candidatus Omnitrophica bacterium]|nr:pyridoxamine 5'-phosphate oxidase family protein [Candidatus Omnitrophota bacterium]